MSAWLIVEFMLPTPYENVEAFDSAFEQAVPAEDWPRASQRKYVYNNTRKNPVRMVFPECAGALDALRALNCSLVSQERIEGPEGET